MIFVEFFPLLILARKEIVVLLCRGVQVTGALWVVRVVLFLFKLLFGEP